MERLQGPGHCPGGPLAPQKASTLDPFKRKKDRKTKRQQDIKTTTVRDAGRCLVRFPNPLPKSAGDPV